MIEVDWEVKDVTTALNRWAEVIRKPVGEVLRKEMQLTLRRVIQAFPPFVTILQPNWTGQLKAGKAATKRDIRQVYVSAEAVFEEILGRADEDVAKAWYGLFKKGKVEEARRILQTVGSRFVNVEMGGALDPAHHKNSRDRRGRVRRHRPAQIVSRAERARYIREVQKSVGWVKAGWLAGVNRFGVTGVPVGIKRLSEAPGVALDASTKIEDPVVTARNDVRYADAIERRGRVIPAVLRARVTAIERRTAALVAKGWGQGPRVKG